MKRKRRKEREKRLRRNRRKRKGENMGVEGLEEIIDDPTSSDEEVSEVVETEVEVEVPAEESSPPDPGEEDPEE
jgi:hypothetical protein